MIKVTNGLTAKGEVSVSLRYKDGTVENIIDKQNLIVDTAKLFILSTLYAGGAVTLDPIVSLKVGTGGCIDPAGLYPKPTLKTQTDLYTPLLTVDASPVIDTGNIKVTFLADVSTDEGNLQQINEAGLFKNSGTIFSVITHPGIYKTSDFAIHYSWTIRIP